MLDPNSDDRLTNRDRSSSAPSNMSKHHPDLIMCRRQPGIGQQRSTSHPMYPKTLLTHDLFLTPQPSVDFARNATENGGYTHNNYLPTLQFVLIPANLAQCVTHTCDRKLSFESVMNVTLAHMEGVVSYAAHQVRTLFPKYV